LLQVRGELLPIEIKLGVAVPDLRGLDTCLRDLGLAQGYVVNLSSQPVDIRRGVWMGGLHICWHASISRHPCTAASRGRDAPTVAHLHAMHGEAALTPKPRSAHEKGTKKGP